MVQRRHRSRLGRDPANKDIVFAWLHILGSRLVRSRPPDAALRPVPAPPERQSLLSDQQLREHARELAATHRRVASGSTDELERHLNRDAGTLARAYRAARAAATERTPEPAAEWLIDNYYVIEEQIKEIRAGLPRSYRRELPAIAGTDRHPLPRVLALMRELATSADGRVHERLVSGFIDAYQDVEPLTLGELWAMPLMLRVALIERLAPLGDAIVTRLDDRLRAAEWADHLGEVARHRPADIVLAIADMARTRATLSPAFATELHRRLQTGNPALSLALAWLEQRLGLARQTLASVLDEETRAQAIAQVSMGNCISGLRTIARTDWSDTVELLSRVERSLHGDPAGVYAAMDFATRDRYRHVVEEMARGSGSAERDIADRAVARAASAEGSAGDSPRDHVGYWLLGAGRQAFERELGVHAPAIERIRRGLRAHPLAGYATPIALLTGAIVVAGVPGIVHAGRVHGALVLAALVVAASHLAVALVNWLVTLVMPPQPLCRLALDHGIPDDLRTLVVVPCMLDDAAGIRELVAALEIRYLANRDANLKFALLADFRDAPDREMPGDAALLAAVREGIEALNRAHEPDGTPRFGLFLRDRFWNAREGAWMGRERKRGKLADLNRVLRGRAPRGFHILVGDPAWLRTVKYVLTLDADTELPPQAALKLVATLAHPLNRPHIDPRLRRVTSGYGVLQPRVSVGATHEGASLLARLFSDEIGLDPYTRMVSNVYQDLFGEASFVGKGIYDVDAFRRTTGARFPDNLILSHDLLEGSYARCGLVSDIELFEHHPDRYSSDLRRRHRWIRGDWQVLAWLLPRVPAPRRQWVRNTLSPYQRWKLLDNLRRSLVPAALLVLLLDGWLLSQRPVYWTLLVLGVIFASPLLISFQHFLARHPRLAWGVHFQLNAEALLRRLQQAGLMLVFLAFEACHHLDAIGRSLWRMLVSHRHLLEWTPAVEAARLAATTPAAYFRVMWTAPVIGIAAVAFALRHGVAAAAVALPVSLLWIASPLIAWALGRPRRRASDTELDATQRTFLRAVARRTWNYFDTFVTAADHGLPPDNHQEYPSEQTAHRTSPTNIGMYLLGALTARDFGYLPTEALLERIDTTLAALEQMPRHRGHFLNWYDTTTLEPLPPRYVSTVDSGNLIACLLVLARGLDAVDGERLLPPGVWGGLADTWRVFRDVLADRGGGPPDVGEAAAMRAIDAALAEAPLPVAALRDHAQALAALAAAIAVLAGRTDGRLDDAPARWLERFRREVDAWRSSLDARAPWLDATPPASEADAALATRLGNNPSLRRTSALLANLAPPDTGDDAGIAWRSHAAGTTAHLAALREHAASLAARCRALADADFDFLWVPEQRLLTIGYHVDQHVRDAGMYDLLASEARLTSFVAIAQGRLPREHWFALGRLLTLAAGRPALVSWSGSMFEYLMPLVVMPGFENTLLTRSCRAVIARQIAYAREHGIPWGISESAYNVTDSHFTYQYRAFGVPGLGLKRGLAEDLVVAPYATALAVPLRSDAACRNLEELARLGALGEYGFIEALDFTPARVPEGARFAPVRAWMAHHQGMSLTALSTALNGRPLQRRFLREPMFRANQLLLREKVPAALTVDTGTLRAEELLAPPRPTATVDRTITAIDTPLPEVQLLSNGRYHVLVTHTGGGASRWGDIALNPWHADATRDGDGIACYVQDLDGGRMWSNTFQPVRAPGRDAVTTFVQGIAEFQRHDHGIDTRTRIAVSPEDDIELRRITLTNRTGSRRRLALTTFTELVLTRRADADAHPGFNKLFIETEYVPGPQALLARRRARAPDEHPPTFLHVIGMRGATVGDASFETRRDVFLGRSGSRRAPAALAPGAALAGGIGAVLDPAFALRREVTLEPGASATFDVVFGAAADRAGAIALAERYADRHLGARVFDLAWTRAQVIRYQSNLSAKDIRVLAQLAAPLAYPDPSLHPPGSPVPEAGQSGLWKFGISGDLPIVLVRIGSLAEIALAGQALQAHRFWSMHGLAHDLVIWNEDPSGYRHELSDRIMGLIGGSAEAAELDRPGGVYVRRSEHLGPDDRVLLQACARLILDGRRGSLTDQVEPPPASHPRAAEARQVPPPDRHALAPTEGLQDFNGTGGHAADGREYVIWLPAGTDTPAPWVNVLANPHLGCVVSERGSAYTFAGNAREFRLTPWQDDAVLDAGGEALYLRDNESGMFWSPTPWPARGADPYRVRHGFGYSVFETVQAGIASTLTLFVARDAPVRYARLRVRNLSTRRRSLAVHAYVEWVLGDTRARGAPHIVTRREGRVITARNPFNDPFAHATAFFATSAREARGSGDRTRFIGRNRDLADPLALHHPPPDDRFGAGLDPCAAWQATLALAPDAEETLVFVLGAGADVEEALSLATASATLTAANAVLEDVRAYWDDLLGRVTIATPDPLLDRLANGWLAYQVIACRLWARSGFYQSGGAFGFRDQLQDAVALLAIEPAFAREQILRAAARQFPEGDVQHWWHPPLGRGVRTRFSDDFLWLPWAVAQYVDASGDAPVLDAEVPFIDGRPLAEGEDSYYDYAAAGAHSASLWTHCVRALDRAFAYGAHGLPLIGSGDWNDGFSRVGHRGRGESVWLAFFLIDVLRRMADLADRRGEGEHATRWRGEADTLAARIDAAAWDGAWYLRAWTDDGAPLGAARNDECRIDSLPQSWASLTATGRPERRVTALDSALRLLVRPEDRLVQLFDPPFDTGALDPGYIIGYLPGIRENGGQYTHAAVWLAMACGAAGRHAMQADLLAMINPLSHALDDESAQRWKVEPYVVAADVYFAPGHRGRGGWSWYTGSAGWFLRAIVESLLGILRRGDGLQFRPRLPPHWPGARVRYRFGRSTYHVRIVPADSGAAGRITCDGTTFDGDTIPLVDDGRDHDVVVPSLAADGGHADASEQGRPQ